MISKIQADGKRVDFSSATIEENGETMIIWGIPTECFKEVFTFELFKRHGFSIEFKMNNQVYKGQADFVRGHTTVGGSNLFRLEILDFTAA
ncbi:hypothetical protein P4159_05725 [Bacillus thuringiensis]|uniref:hypothetical protein n=1 Tax=Bacillus thuringiensis TaxID=1428 RepID=UPI000CD7ED41|nr:hypothetical protein [Bacillus thuringiensis]MEC3417090.1 hypothetical protein [Bacillus cereus]MEC3596909.1 hypothetical protein [Bacillus thuringiensis]MED1836182.1 hypothetical protein [Bacillus thuringiensis]MED2670245.1 hypothetical protein [Bacillus thuringiensis]MED2694222.1 hypothetical protein [Bacillus thuringiensis]